MKRTLILSPQRNCDVPRSRVGQQHREMTGSRMLLSAYFRELLVTPPSAIICFSQGCVPSAWTCSTIIPVPKPGTDTFRPVSLTSCFSKVMERILLSRLINQLESELSPCLFGFLPRRSTHHCLAELYSRHSSSRVVAFIDLKSAFDVANRDIILDQLVEFGIKGHILMWPPGYFRNRASMVFFHGAYSSFKNFDLGTPQGGVLSPFLFNIGMHRLVWCSSSHSSCSPWPTDPPFGTRSPDSSAEAPRSSTVVDHLLVFSSFSCRSFISGSYSDS